MGFGFGEAIAAASGLLTTAIDKIWPDPEAKARSEAVAMAAAAQAAISQLEAAQAVMVAEAKSADPWTSRARPSFLYVIYVCILAGIPMGALFAFSPTIATNVTNGFTLWLAAIPEPMWQLFGIGYLGYSGGRTFEKIKGVAK